MDSALDYLPPTSGQVESAYPTRAEALAAVPHGRCFITRLDSQGVVLQYTENGTLSRKDGPASIAFRLDGTPEVTAYYLDGELHRVRAPAHFHHDSSGTAMGPWEYFRHGKLHRISGPAKEIGAYSWYGLWAAGGFDFDEWWCDGVKYEKRSDLFAALAAAGPDAIAAAFIDTEFESLTYTGEDLRASLAAIEGGVRTPTGVREVLAGTPVDWIVSFEAGGALGFATAGASR